MHAGVDIRSIAESRHSLEDVSSSSSTKTSRLRGEELQLGQGLAILQKELRDDRRNRFVIYTMAALPLLFLAIPIVQLFTVNAPSTSARVDTRIGISLLYMLILPAIIPSVLSAYSVVGEREQGTLDPVLTTPIQSEEFIVGKALAAFLPALLFVYAILGAVAIFAHPAISSAVFERDHLLVQLLFTPLVAGWSVWVGIAVSTRVSDVRAAPAALPPGQSAAPGHRGPHVVQRPLPLARSRSGARRSPSGDRRAGMAGRGHHVRPRTPRYRWPELTHPNARNNANCLKGHAGKGDGRCRQPSS